MAQAPVNGSLNQRSAQPTRRDLGLDPSNLYIGRSWQPDDSSLEISDENQGTALIGDNDEEDVCGDDERTLLNDPTLGRGFRRLCTFFRIEENIYATAGHCLRKSRIEQVVFNVPPSDETGNMHYPNPLLDHTFPILARTIRCSDCVLDTDRPHGEDWAVFSLGRNAPQRPSVPQLPESIYQFENYDLVSDFSEAAATRTAYVVGFGFNINMLTNSRALQSAAGNVHSVIQHAPESVVVHHLVDTESGNSGSPIFAANADGTPSNKWG